eukprot:c17389_g1_i3 orf=28-411(-)
MMKPGKLVSLTQMPLVQRKAYETRRSLEEVWKKQQEEVKKRWDHRIEPFTSSTVGIFPEKRYTKQDEEPIRNATVITRVSNARALQVKEHKAKQQQELEERLDYERQQETAQSCWERMQAKVCIQYT